jgi:hypothetical protein
MDWCVSLSENTDVKLLDGGTHIALSMSDANSSNDGETTIPGRYWQKAKKLNEI